MDRLMAPSRVRSVAAACGLAGPLALTVYFGAPALMAWPFSGTSANQLRAYVLGHQTLFYAGAWFQVTGTLLSVVFFLAIVQLSGSTARLSGLLVIVASTALLSLVLVEAALLVAVPSAAAAGDTATMVTTFDLSNGTFVRVFPLAPASITYMALGAVIVGSGLLHRWLGVSAIGLGIAFELSGVLAVISGIGLIVTIVLSAGQELWVVAAAIAMWRSRAIEAGSAY